MIKILYIGNSNFSSTSYQRAKALERIGHEVMLCDPYLHLDNSGIWQKIHFKTGYKLIQGSLEKWINSTKQLLFNPNLIWINGGELFGPNCIYALKELNVPIILYTNDDPTGKRDGYRFASLLQSLPFYDLCVVMRNIQEIEFKIIGAKEVLRLFMSYDEEAHKPFCNSIEIDSKFHSDVAFIGTWMRHESRDRFLLDLIDDGIPISIWGNRWEKSPFWQNLRQNYRGGALGGRDYVAAIQGSKICLGMLSIGNRDLHTQRSFEIPFIGGLLCAERTSEHQYLYEEGVEAVFWKDSKECSGLCKVLLNDAELRNSIRIRGRNKVLALNAGNEDVCRNIINKLRLS